MKPAVCAICGKYAVEEQSGFEGGWVEFADWKVDKLENISHPKGLEYFCFDHLSFAQKLKSKAVSDAIDELREYFGSIENNTLKENSARSWWKNLLRL